MCSQQSGNIQDISTLTSHQSSCIVGESEPDSSSRQDYASPPAQLSDMGLRYMNIPNIPNDDTRFSPEPLSSHQSPVYSLEPAVQSNASSTLGIPPFNNYYPSTQNLSAYSNGHGGSTYFSPTSLFSPMSDLKPRLGAVHPSPGLPQLRGSPALSQISPPLSARELYSSHNPGVLRRPSDLLTRSPVLSGSLRGVPISPTSTSGFTSPIANMDSSLGAASVPPMYATEVNHSLTASDGQVIKPDIFARIDKGFFLADNDWTCYRRNYFSLNCSYTLNPTIPTGSIYLQLHGKPPAQVHGFAMSIGAVVDGRDGKSIELVQHTPKRDKGPQEKPARITLAPLPPTSHSVYDSIAGRSNPYDFNQNPNQPATEATFERIQFKNATANNGKRRAAQQYYHLLVELYVDVGSQHPDGWVKIASRMSAPMVVRGRSPGHYQSERRGSNTSNGPGGPGGGPGSYAAGGSTGRGHSDMSMGGASAILSGSGYGGGYDGRSHHYRSAMPPVNVPLEPTLSREEAKNIEESPCYMYYPGPIWEGGGDNRYHLPAPEYTTSKVRTEYGNGGYVLPSLSATQDGSVGGRHCGRWDGVLESKGYFPSALVQQEMNIT